jgi:hypothetical protein
MDLRERFLAVDAKEDSLRDLIRRYRSDTSTPTR